MLRPMLFNLFVNNMFGEVENCTMNNDAEINNLSYSFFSYTESESTNVENHYFSQNVI